MMSPSVHQCCASTGVLPVGRPWLTVKVRTAWVDLATTPVAYVVAGDTMCPLYMCSAVGSAKVPYDSDSDTAQGYKHLCRNTTYI